LRHLRSIRVLLLLQNLSTLSAGGALLPEITRGAPKKKSIAAAHHPAFESSAGAASGKTAQATAITTQQALSPVRPQNLEGV